MLSFSLVKAMYLTRNQSLVTVKLELCMWTDVETTRKRTAEQERVADIDMSV